MRIATDQTDYFSEIERLAAQSRDFVRIADLELPASASTFEKRFLQEGLEIHRLALRKVSPSKNGVASQ